MKIVKWSFICFYIEVTIMKTAKMNLNIKHALYCLIFISLFSISLKAQEHTTRSQIRYIQTFEDYAIHTQHHINSVNNMAMYLYNAHKNNLFSDVHEDVVREKLRDHDSEKFATLKKLEHLADSIRKLKASGAPIEIPQELDSVLEKLRRLNYGENEPVFLKRLYEVVGKNKSNPLYEEKINEILKDLLVIEQVKTILFLAKYSYINSDGSIHPIGEKILTLEKVPDVVDRALDPGSAEELGLRVAKDAREYLKTFMEIYLAEELIPIRDNLVTKHPLTNNIRRGTSNTCRALFK